MEDIAEYPLVTYEPAFTARTEVMRVFEKAGIEPKLKVSAIDADVIKTCVEQGLGITVLSRVTFDPRRDRNLVAIRAGHLFKPSTTKLLFSRHRYLVRYEYDFIEMFAPTWTRAKVQQLLAQSAA